MLKKFAPLVKNQIEYWQHQIDQYGPGHPRFRPAKIERYRALVADFTELLGFLNEHEGTQLEPQKRVRLEKKLPQATIPAEIKASVAPPAKAPQPALEPEKDDLSDLPPELLAELSEGAKAQTDPIIKIIHDRGGTATMDEILIDLYRRTGEVNKRTVIGNKLFRLSKREMCWSVPGKKGVYTTVKPEGDGGSDDTSKESTNEDPKSESPPAATDGPSKDSGVAGLPGGSPKVSAVGPTPTTSTVIHRSLLSGTSSGSLLPWQPPKRR